MILPNVRHSDGAAPAEPASAAHRFLVVDDEASVRIPLARFLATCGYEVQAAGSADAALELLRDGEYVGMLCDVRMPGKSGLDLLPEVRALDPDLAVLMLTAVNDASTATGALSAGAMDYLTKPIELETLRIAVERAVHRRRLAIDQRRVEYMIREEVAQRTEELEREKESLRSLTVNVAETLINAMEAKDIYLRGHSQRVADLAASIADLLGLGADTVEHVRLAGRLHDVGKIGIRENVLNKPGPLTPEEFEHVKGHVRIGMEILAPLSHLGVVLDYVHDHHEHWDGSGYPRGLKGEEITIGGRILAAADAFDALTSKRAYREPMAPEAVLAFLAERHVGTLLDPRVFVALRVTVAARRSVVLPFIDDLHG